MSGDEKPVVPKTALDLQKMKLEKLMQNPNKPVIIPERPKEKKGHSVPEFVRNVMGSSAGAGSGEFHVYRHLRRKEYSRQKVIDEMAQKEELDKAYRMKLIENQKAMEERTAKKRAKRLKKKQRAKKRKSNNTKGAEVKTESATESDSSESDNSDSETDETELDVAGTSDVPDTVCNEAAQLEPGEVKSESSSDSVKSSSSEETT